MSLSLEDYLAKNRKTNPDVCFKTDNRYRRFKVHTCHETYVFPWIQVVYSTLSLDENELIIYLNQHTIEIIGFKLKPIHEAIAQDSLEFIRMLSRELLSAEATEGTTIQSIEVHDKAATKALKKTKLEALEGPSALEPQN
jgi:hypothetical protein